MKGKFLLAFAAAIGCAAVQASVSFRDGTLTINGETTLKNLGEVLSGEYADYYTALRLGDEAITNVVLSGASQVRLTEDLDYTGAWNLSSATAYIGSYDSVTHKVIDDPTSPFGKGTGAAALITVNAASGSQIQNNGYCVNGVIDAPIRIVSSSSSSKALYLNGGDNGNGATSTLRLNGPVEVTGSCNFHFQGGKVILNMYGGLTATNGTVSTTGANGNWNVYDVPVALKAFQPNYIYLNLRVAGNEIRDINFSQEGGKVVLYADGALDGCIPLVQNFKASTGFNLNGHDATVYFNKDVSASGVGFTCGSGSAVLTVSNDVDVTYGVILTGNTTLRKIGSGKLTFSGALASSCKLEVLSGTVAFGSAATWSACPEVSVVGGRVELASNQNLPETVNFILTDAARENQVLLPAGTATACGQLKVGDSVMEAGTYGSSASGADTKLPVFDAASDGVLEASGGGEVLNIVVTSGTKTLSEVLTGAELTKLENNEYVSVVKSGVGVLRLDRELNYTGAWTISGGGAVAAVSARAFGKNSESAAVQRPVTVRHDADAYIQFDADDAVLERPIVVYATASANPSAAAIRLCSNRKSLTLSGKIDCRTGLLTVFHPTGVSLTTSGGIEAPGGIKNAGASQTWNVTENPVSASRWTMTYESVRFKVAGNSVSTFEHNIGGVLHVDVDDAFANVPKVTFATHDPSVADNGSIYLNGHDLSVDFDSAALWSTRISSSSPATLTFGLTKPASTNNQFVVEGKASLKKVGDGTFVTKKSFTSSGTLEVAGGTFELAPGAKWTSCTGVTLSGGRLVTHEDGVFGDGSSATLTVADAAATDVLSIADGTVLRFKTPCLFGNAPMDVGFYGSGASAGQLPCAFLDPNTTGRLYVNNVLTITVASGSQTLAEAVDAATLQQINANVYTRIVKKGAGTLVLDQALDYAWTWYVEEGRLKATAPQNAFGKPGLPGYDGVECACDDTYNGGVIVGVAGQDTYVDKPITLVATGTHGFSARQAFDVYGKVHLAKTLTFDASVYAVIYGNDSVGHLYCDGGVTNSRGQVTMNAAGGRWYLNEPSYYTYFAPIWIKLYVEKPGNVIKTLTVLDGATLNVLCEDAFAEPLPSLTLTVKDNSTPKMNLNGHFVEVGDLDLIGEGAGTPASARGTSTISSADPGTLSFRQKTNRTNDYVRVTGNVSLVKGGDASFTFNTNITATGTLTVTGGVFALTAKTTWANCTNVTVCGEGAVFELNADSPIDTKAGVRLANGGKMALNGAIEVAAGVVWFEDEEEVSAERGTYGSSASNAQFKDDVHFTGTGVLRVTRSKGHGAMLLVR